MDIRRSDLPLLISLDVLLEERNVTRAAKRLNLTQPALSAQLGRLRDLFDDPLLVPSESGRGMAPTDKALALQSRLHQALLDLQGAVLSSGEFDPMVADRTFVVATNDNIFTIVGIAVAQAILGQHAPHIRLCFVAPSEVNLSLRMERGEIDLYVGLAEQVPESLKSRHLLTDEFQMAQRRGHPRGTGDVSLEEYCRLDHVMVSQEGRFHSSVDDSLLALGHQRSVAITVAGYNQLALVLADTDCVATMPSRFLRRYASGLDILKLPFHFPSFDLAMAWHSRAHEDPAHQWLRQRFVQAAGHPIDTDIWSDRR
jgi:DNA-binding transcriptional LysR family regulator